MTTTLNDLTPRMRQVAVLTVLWGLSREEVADRLGISPRTVRFHMRRIGERMDLPVRRAMAEYCRAAFTAFDELADVPGVRDAG